MHVPLVRCLRGPRGRHTGGTAQVSSVMVARMHAATRLGGLASDADSARGAEERVAAVLMRGRAGVRTLCSSRASARRGGGQRLEDRRDEQLQPLRRVAGAPRQRVEQSLASLRPVGHFPAGVHPWRHGRCTRRSAALHVAASGERRAAAPRRPNPLPRRVGRRCGAAGGPSAASSFVQPQVASPSHWLRTKGR